MEVRLLGPVGLWRAGREVGLPRPHRRCVLAVLAMTPGRVVPSELLVDRVWGERPPREPMPSLYTHISAIRRAVQVGGGHAGEAELRRVGGGYVLDIAAEQVDLHRARRCTRQARELLTASPDEVAPAATLLREACGLWLGPPLGGVKGDWAARSRDGLVQEWLAVVTQRFTVELRLGEHAAVVGQLAGLLADYPLTEPLVGLQMSALYRCGRQAEALELFQQTRRRLIDELGEEPGAELRQVHEQVLRRASELDPPPDRVRSATAPAQIPAQLPRDVTGFTGRRSDLRELDSLLGDEGTSAPVLTICGTAGVGKTALAVHWAHQARDRFPDGQLYIDLRGYALEPPLRPVEALARLLTALGVPGEKVPLEIDVAAAMHRSMLADKRVLLVLDNAADADQVRPLLPAGAGCAVLVTSRGRLSGLAAREGGHHLDLAGLAPAEARTLLARMVGAARVAAEPEAAEQLAELCGLLPLALRVAAANLAARPHRRIAEYVARLRHDRLPVLAVPGDPGSALATTFQLSYLKLPEDARRIFRLLGLLSGPDITAAAVAAAAGTDADAASQLLETLTHAYLVEEHVPGRYRCHDLLRRFAADRATAEDDAKVRSQALSRLHLHYAAIVEAAAQRLYPEKLRLPVAPRGQAPVEQFDDHAAARAWLDQELPNLVGAVRQASEHGTGAPAWQLADALRGYFFLSRQFVDWLAVAGIGMARAEAEGDLAGQAACQLSLGDAHLVQSRHREAAEHYRRAAELGQRLGSVSGEVAAWAPHVRSAALNNLGIVLQRSGQLRAAADHYTQALHIGGEVGFTVGAALHLGNLGGIYQALGRLDLALESHTKAWEIHRAAGNRATEAAELRELGQTRHAMGDYDLALDFLAEALRLHRKVGDRANEAVAQRILAIIHNDLGKPAAELATGALALTREVGERVLEADALHTLASVQVGCGRFLNAVDNYLEALKLAQETQASGSLAEALIGLSIAVHRLGKHDQAREHLERAMEITREGEFRILEGRALTVLAGVHLAEGETEHAMEASEAALKVHCSTGYRLGEAHSRLILGRVARRRGQRGAESQLRQAYAMLRALGVPDWHRCYPSHQSGPAA